MKFKKIFFTTFLICMSISGCAISESSEENKTEQSNNDSESSEENKTEQFNNEIKIGINQEGDDVWIVGKNGDIIASSSNGDFDMILDGGYGSEDGFYGLLKTYSDFDSTGFMIGIMDENGNWIKEYNKCDDSLFCFDKNSQHKVHLSYFLDRNQIVYDAKSSYTYNDTCLFTYCGNGVFAYAMGSFMDVSYKWHFYSIYDECEYISPVKIYIGQGVYAVDAFGTVENLFRTGEDALIVSMSGTGTYEMYYLSRDGDYDYVDIISRFHGKEGTDMSCTRIGVYSDGGWIYYNSEDQLMYYQPGEEPICICNDSDKVDESRVSSFRFIEGRAVIYLKGADNQLYKAIVNKQGDYLEEPHLLFGAE